MSYNSLEYSQLEQEIRLAKIMAITAHGAIGQKRKYTGEPYYRHCLEVAAIVETVEHTKEMLCAAWLHDVIEDTKIEINIIEAFLGEEVARMVIGLTEKAKLEDGNREVRKKIDRDFLATQCDKVQTIKVADLIANAYSIIKYDKGFAKVYMAEVKELYIALTKANTKLRLKLKNIIDNYYNDTLA